MSRKKKYPTLWGCYIEEGFQRRYTRKYLQGVVHLHHHKGHILLSVLPEPKKEKCSCYKPPPDYAWLDGDDLDALIKILRDAKKTWLKAYNKAKRELARRPRRKPKKSRERSQRSPRMTAGGTDFSYED